MIRFIHLRRRGFLGSALALSGGIAMRRWLPAAVAAERRNPRLTLEQLDEAALEAEVCVIGSGPAGAILAKTLTDRGIATLLVESGPDLESNDVADTARLDAYSSRGEIDYPLASTRFRGTGGTSNLWTGLCPRFHPLDFEPNSYTPAGAPWPIRYADLETYYLRAEEELRVRGVNDAPFAPPRRDPFPRLLTPHTPNFLRLLEVTDTGIVPQYLPQSDADGRPVKVAESHVRTFRSSPHGALVCGATATAILTDAGGRVTGVRLRAIGKPTRVARALRYVIACGGVESARLLLLSRGPGFPDGIGNHADLVGRCFMEHAAAAVGSGTVRGLWDPRSGYERIFSERSFVEAKEMGFGGVRLRLLLSRERLDPQLRHPLESLRRGLRAMRELDLGAKVSIEMEPSPQNRVVLDDRRRDAFGNPGASVSLQATERDRKTMRFAEELVRPLMPRLGAENVAVEVGLTQFEHHHMGTCRMGDNPRTSVVDRNLRVHGCDNLYVAGSAPFVTGSVSNPTLTIVALSLRLADHLSGILQRRHGERDRGRLQSRSRV